MSSVRAALPVVLLFAAGFGLAMACGTGGSGGNGTMNGGDDAAAGNDTGNPPMPEAATDSAADGDGPIAMMDSPSGPPPYPPGPYGINVGDVLQNLSWDGYVNKTGAALSTTLPYGPTSLQDLRGDGHGYALIHLSDFY
jgi:hypothetical protein